MSIAPSNPQAHKREMEIRALARLEAMESKLDAYMINGGAAALPPPAFLEPTAEDVEFVGEVLYSYDSIPVGHVLSFGTRRDGPPLVTSLSVAGLGGFSIAEAIRVGLLTTGGSFVRSTYERLLSERPGNSGRWLHPSGNAANPVFEPLRQSAD